MSVAQKTPETAAGLADMPLADRALLQFEAEQFFYEEAALLDGRRYTAWLDLLTEDIRYWMPIRRTVTLANIDQEFTRPGDMAFFDEDKDLLRVRVAKMESGSSWSEDPPSRSRHFVSNVRVTGIEGDEVATDVAFHLYRSRLNTEVDSWVGRREDVLRRENGMLKLARRSIYLDQTLIRATNMSTLF